MAKELRALFDELKRDLRADFKELRESFDRDVRKELREMNTFITFANKHYEEIKAENQVLKASNAKLEEQCAELARQVKDHEARILQAEQYSRSTNVEIKGIPDNASEDLTDLLIRIGEKVEVSLAAADFEAIHRVPTAKKDTQQNIVVQFARRQQRDNFLQKARAARLKCSDLGLGSEEPVFVNEHLCPELKRLLGQATARKRETGWKYVWVQNGKIYARKMDNGPRIRILSSEDVAKMRSSP